MIFFQLYLNKPLNVQRFKSMKEEKGPALSAGHLCPRFFKTIIKCLPSPRDVIELAKVSGYLWRHSTLMGTQIAQP